MIPIDRKDLQAFIEYALKIFSHTRSMLLLTLCMLIFLSCTWSCSKNSRLSPGDGLDRFQQYLDNQIPEMLRKYDVPGVSLAIIRDGEIVLTDAYGFAEIESGRRMTVDAICRAESISKSVSAWGIMTLVQKGRVDLDEPIIRYLSSWSFPPSNYDEQQITIRQLLSNSAGLPLGTVGEETEYSPGSEMPSITQYLDQEARLAHRPGSRFEYSNPGYNTLELVVEDITGEHFSEYMQHALLHPLNMTEASYAWRGPYAQSIPTGYELDGDPVPAYVYPVQASGGLFANVKDIGRFVSAGISALQTESSTVLDPYFVKMIYTPQIEIKGLLGLVADSYGFGHFIETLPGGQNAIWHGGQGHGWMTHFHMIPETGDGIVILTNSQRSWPLIAELLLDWSEWIGIGPVKFSRIVYATKAGWLVTGLVTGWAVLIFSQLGINLMNGKSKLEPFSKHKLATRFAKFSSGFVLFGLVILRTLQPYVFESSIFPGLIRWFAASVLVLSSAMLISSLFIDVQTRPLDN